MEKNLVSLDSYSFLLLFNFRFQVILIWNFDIYIFVWDLCFNKYILKLILVWRALQNNPHSLCGLLCKPNSWPFLIYYIFLISGQFHCIPTESLQIPGSILAKLFIPYPIFLQVLTPTRTSLSWMMLFFFPFFFSLSYFVSIIYIWVLSPLRLNA